MKGTTAVVVLSVLGLGHAWAESYTFATIDVPGAGQTFISGINDSGSLGENSQFSMLTLRTVELLESIMSAKLLER